MNTYIDPDPLASGGSEFALDATVRRFVDQCSSLLRLQLERKIKVEPHVYDRVKLHRVIADFDAVARDIETTVSTRVRARVLEMIQGEVRRVFEDAMQDLEGAIRIDGSEPDEAPLPEASQDHPASQDHHERSVVYLDAVRESQPAEAGLVDDAAQERDEIRDGAKAFEPPREPAAPIFAADTKANAEPSLSDETQIGVPGDGIYQGKVRLLVEVGDNSRQLVSFVEELRRKTELRLLQLVGNRNETAEAWVWLRMPLHLQEFLGSLGAVAEVTPHGLPQGDDEEPVLGVRLRDAAAVN